MPRRGRRVTRRGGRGRRMGRSRGGGIRQGIARLRSENGTCLVRLGGVQTFASDGGGTLSGVILADPTAISGGNLEYNSYWLNLYSEVKLVQLRVQFLPNFSETKDVTILTGTPLAIAASTNAIAPPSSVDAVLDNANSILYNMMNDTSQIGRIHTLRGTQLAWAAATSPGGLTYAGTPGSIQIFGQNYPASYVLLICRYELIVLMRNRV